MKKVFKLIYCILFLAICSAPLCFMPFVKNDASLEKRELTKFPAYLENGRLNVDFSTQFEDWFNDRIPFRPYLLTAANAVKGELLHAPTYNVIVGKQGWLFYESEALDYMDANALSEAQVNAAVISLSLMQEAVEKKGGSFVFVPMPNKASVYGDYMPAQYAAAEENNLSRITSRAKAVGVNCVDMRKLLTEHKEEGLYHRRDSHWNYRGALLGYRAILEALSKEHKSYDDAPFTLEHSWRGDLDKLLYPAGGIPDDQYVYEIAWDPFRFTKPAGVRDPAEQLSSFMSDREEGDDLFRTNNLKIGDGSVLYMARDSFGRALLPFNVLLSCRLPGLTVYPRTHPFLSHGPGNNGRA